MTDYTISEVLPGVYRVPVPLEGSPLKELNSYVFKKTDRPGSRNMVVDTGYYQDSCMNALTEAFELLDVDLKETDFLLTHLHADHISCVPYLVQDECKVYMGAGDIAKMYLDGSDIPHKGSYEYSFGRVNELGVPMDKQQEMREQMAADIFTFDKYYRDYIPVNDGDVLTAGSYTLKAIHTPGHTPGHMCYEIENTGAMLLGDTLLFDISPNIVAWIGVKDSLGDYLDSLDKLDSYDVSIPLPGHRHRGDFHTRIAELKLHHSKRIEECYKTIEELGDAYLYDIAGNVQWKIKSRNWDEFPPVQRWFALGECIAHLDYLARRGRIVQLTDRNGIKYYRTC